MKTFLYIFQKLIKCSLIWAVLFIWLKFALTSTLTALLLALGLTILLELISSMFSRKKKDLKSLKMKEKSEAEDMYISLLTSKNVLTFFKDLLASRFSTVVEDNEFIRFAIHNGKKFLLFPYFKIQKLSPDAIFDIASNTNINEEETLLILCGEMDTSCTSYIPLLPFKVVVLDKYETYKYFYKEYEFYPQLKATTPLKKRVRFKNTVNSIFNKSRASSFIFAGVVILLSSTFVPYKIYYQIFASMLFVVAIVCLTLKPKTSKKDLF